jgi:hypothetical protein
MFHIHWQQHIHLFEIRKGLDARQAAIRREEVQVP